MTQSLLLKDIWIVIPAHNEDKYLAQVLHKVKHYAHHIVVVDDGSTDHTSEIAQKAGVVSIKHRLNLGKGAALRTGCEYAFHNAGAKAIIMLDADDQHDAAEIPTFVTALQKGYEVIFGVRTERKNMPWLKRKVNRLSSFLTYLLFGEYVPDIPSGYKAFTSRAYKSLAWNATGYAVELEIVARTAEAHLPYTTVNIKTIYHDMDKGMTALDVLAIVRYLLKLKVTL